jgi:hypothetical protein
MVGQMNQTPSSVAQGAMEDRSIELRRAKTRAALQWKIFQERQENASTSTLADLIVGREGRFTVFGGAAAPPYLKGK